jgi:hypothetical protein
MAAAYTFSVPEKSLGAVLLCTYVSSLNKYLLCMIRYNTLIHKSLCAVVSVGVTCNV